MHVCCVVLCIATDLLPNLLTFILLCLSLLVLQESLPLWKMWLAKVSARSTCSDDMEDIFKVSNKISFRVLCNNFLSKSFIESLQTSLFHITTGDIFLMLNGTIVIQTVCGKYNIMFSLLMW